MKVKRKIIRSYIEINTIVKFFKGPWKMYSYALEKFQLDYKCKKILRKFAMTEINNFIF